LLTDRGRAEHPVRLRAHATRSGIVRGTTTAFSRKRRTAPRGSKHSAIGHVGFLDSRGQDGDDQASETEVERPDEDDIPF
jgi:hypothetical protein